MKIVILADSERRWASLHTINNRKRLAFYYCFLIKTTGRNKVIHPPLTQNLNLPNMVHELK